MTPAERQAQYRASWTPEEHAEVRFYQRCYQFPIKLERARNRINQVSAHAYCEVSGFRRAHMAASAKLARLEAEARELGLHHIYFSDQQIVRQTSQRPREARTGAAGSVPRPFPEPAAPIFQTENGQ